VEELQGHVPVGLAGKRGQRGAQQDGAKQGGRQTAKHMFHGKTSWKKQKRPVAEAPRRTGLFQVPAETAYSAPITYLT
jgi:hypothetical protein